MSTNLALSKTLFTFRSLLLSVMNQNSHLAQKYQKPKYKKVRLKPILSFSSHLIESVTLRKVINLAKISSEGL